MHDQIAHWLQRLRTLRVDRSRGDPAPHKPLLLLIVVKQAANEEQFSRVVTLSPSLTEQFALLWNAISHRRPGGPDISLPFFHLKGDGVWSVTDLKGRPAAAAQHAKVAFLDDSLFACLKQPQFRRDARSLLLSTYFSMEEQRAIAALLPASDDPHGTSAGGGKENNDDAKLSYTQRRILAALEHEPLTADNLSQLTEAPIEVIIREMLPLEMKKLIERRHGVFRIRRQ